MEIERQLGLPHLWDKKLILDCFWEYFNRPSLKVFRVLLILVVWGVWLDMNASLFEDKCLPMIKVSQYIFSSSLLL
jgi:hypothetical protein